MAEKQKTWDWEEEFFCMTVKDNCVSHLRIFLRIFIICEETVETAKRQCGKTLHYVSQKFPCQLHTRQCASARKSL